MLKTLTTMAAVAALALPTAVMAAEASSPAASLSVRSAQAVKPVRASGMKKGQNEAAGSTGIIIGVIAAAAVIGGIVIASDNDSDTPDSP